MKRLLTGLLLIGVVGCGSRLQKLGVEIERNEQGIQSSPLIFMEAHPGCLNDSIIGRVGFPTLPSFQGISLSPLWPRPAGFDMFFWIRYFTTGYRRLDRQFGQPLPAVDSESALSEPTFHRFYTKTW